MTVAPVKRLCADVRQVTGTVQREIGELQRMSEEDNNKINEIYVFSGFLLQGACERVS